MVGYNVDTGEEYVIRSSYKSKDPLMTPENNSYGGSNPSNVVLQIYSSSEQPVMNQKSRCPRGALLGSIGTCCGMNCTRACALPS